MKTRTHAFLILSLALCALAALQGALVRAAPPVPASFYGTVKVNGANVPTYVQVEALIGGVTYAVGPVQVSGADTVYALNVPGDIPETPGKEGGTTGETIQFRVGGLLCAQTAVWQSGAHTNLNLTATGTLPTLTPTNTSVPTNTPTPTFTPTNTPAVTATPRTVDFTPDNTTVRDTYISSYDPTVNDGNGQRIRVKYSVFRSLIYFDLASIPTGSTVQSAKLRLYLDWYDDGKPTATPRVAVYKVLRGWEELQATWNKATSDISWGTAGCESASDRSFSESGAAVISTVNTWYEWDITALVQDWVSNPAGNRGLILISNHARELRFHSANAPTNKPLLRVTYTAGGGPVPTVTITPSPTTTASVQPTPQTLELRGASQDAYINYADQTRNYEHQGLRIQGQGYKRSLLNFDVSAIPPQAEIISATLRLTASNYDDGKGHLSLNVGAYLVNRAWVANQVTWLLASTGNSWATAGCEAVPADRAGTPASTTRVQEISGTRPWEIKTYTWDVTAIVQAWVNNPSAQAGLLLLAQDVNYRDVGFYDSAYGVVEQRPLLVVQWRPRPAATETPTPTPEPARGAIQGLVFNDLNGNGRRDAGEPGLAGAVVQLWQGGVMRSAQTTAASGTFAFGSLDPGAYLVKEIDPPGYRSSPGSPNEVAVTVSANQTSEVNFADHDPASITLLSLPLIRKG